MTTVLTRLLREDARRLLLLSAALAGWFALIMLVVRNSGGLVTAKTEMAGSAMTRGFGIGDLASADAMLAQMTGVSFNHPLVLALVGAASVAPGVRACHGELARGTLELTLARPIARWRYLLAYAAHALIGTTLLMVVAWVSMVGFDRLFAVPGTLDAGNALVACAHAGLVFCSFGSIALLTSVALARRGNATFVAVGVLTAMFAVTFAERAWSARALDVLDVLSVFHGFDPGATLLGAPTTAGDVVVPLVVALAGLAIALWRFERRDL